MSKLWIVLQRIFIKGWDHWLLDCNNHTDATETVWRGLWSGSCHQIMFPLIYWRKYSIKHSSWDVDILLQIRYLSELRLSSMPFILILQAGKNHLGVETGLTQHLEVQLNWNLITWYIYETLWRQWGHQSGSAIWFCSCQWS